MRHLFPIILFVMLISNSCKKEDCDINLTDGNNSQASFFYNGKGLSPKYAKTGYFEEKGDLIVINAMYGSELTKITITYDSKKIKTENGNTTVMVDPDNIVYVSSVGFTYTNTEATLVKVFKNKKKHQDGSVGQAILFSPNSGSIILEMGWGLLCEKK